VEVDEVSAGSWNTPLVDGVSPDQWLRGQTPEISIAGQNLIETPAVFLDGIELGSVNWVSPTLLTAAAPPELAPGWYDLTVANPNGSAATRPGAVTVTQLGAFLPFAAWNGPPVSPDAGAPWPTLGHDIRHSGQSDTDPGASRYALAWTASQANPGGSELESIAVADGVVVASVNSGGSDCVVGLDAETGEELWRHSGTGDSATPPSIAHGSVYYQRLSYSGSGSYCLELYTGAPRWAQGISSSWCQGLAPLVVGDTVYAYTGSYGGLRSYHALDGRLLWYNNMYDWDKWTPAYAEGTLYSFVNGVFRAHDPGTGYTQWSLDLGSCAQTYTIDTAPVLAGETALVTCMDDLNAIDLGTHSLLWTTAGDYGYTIPAVADEVVYALKSGGLEERRLTDGALLWSFAGDAGLDNAPVIAGKYVYVASATHTYVLDRTTHAVTWQVDHGGWLAVADGFLYIGQPDQAIYAYRAQEP